MQGKVMQRKFDSEEAVGVILLCSNKGSKEIAISFPGEAET